jgi:hypothetical protein
MPPRNNDLDATALEIVDLPSRHGSGANSGNGRDLAIELAYQPAV